MVSDLPSLDSVHVLGYADDLTFCTAAPDLALARIKMQEYLNLFSIWLQNNGLVANSSKTKVQLYTRRRERDLCLHLNGERLEVVASHRVLGLHLDAPQLSWKPHIRATLTDCQRRADILRGLSSTSWGSSYRILRTFYISYIRAKMDYGSQLYASGPQHLLLKLTRLQNACLRNILGARKTTPVLSLEVESFIVPLHLRRQYLISRTFLRLLSRPSQDVTADLLQITGGSSPSGAMSSFRRRATSALHYFGVRSWRRLTVPPRRLPPQASVDAFLDASSADADGPGVHLLFEDTMAHRYAGFHRVYTDGSKLQDGGASCAVYLQTFQRSWGWKLNPSFSIYSA